MTTEFVLRLDKKRAEHFQKEARKRRKTPTALMRQALDNLIGDPPSNPTARRPAKAGNKDAGKQNGVGWKQHFELLRKRAAKEKTAKRGVGWPQRLKKLRELDRAYGKQLPILDIVEQMRAIDMNGCR